MTLSSTNSNLGAIFGTGRSGSTWLGAIVASHPDVVYRFEPVHRLKDANSDMGHLLKLARSDQFSPEYLPQLYQVLLPAYPECDKPPFFKKHYPLPLSVGRAPLWMLARRNTIGSHLFRTLYTPKGSPFLVFKEVALVEMMNQLLEKTSVPVVYLMRHPCAVVWSVIRGQQADLMPAGQRQFLQSLLEKNSPELAERYGSRLETLSIAEQEALLWRSDVERAVDACQAHSNGLLVIYEDLFENPVEIATQVLNHFGLDMVDQTLSFIEESTTGTSSSRLKRWEFGINSYFTVFRGSQSSSDSWRKKMPEDYQKQVMDIVQDCKPFAIAANRGIWS